MANIVQKSLILPLLPKERPETLPVSGLWAGDVGSECFVLIPYGIGMMLGMALRAFRGYVVTERSRSNVIEIDDRYFCSSVQCLNIF